MAYITNYIHFINSGHILAILDRIMLNPTNTTWWYAPESVQIILRKQDNAQITTNVVSIIETHDFIHTYHLRSLLDSDMLIHETAIPAASWMSLHEAKFSWWRHQMETFSAVTGEFPSQKPVTRSFGVFFDLRQNKRLSKQSRRRWFETPSRSLWRHCNVLIKLEWWMRVDVRFQ